MGYDFYPTTAKVWVFGSGGFSKEVQWLIDETPHFEFAEFISENREELFHQVLQDTLRTHPGEIFYGAMGVGTPAVIKKIHTKFINHRNLQWPNIIHPSVLGDFPHINMGPGTLICAGNILTTAIRLGAFNILNLGSTIGHDLDTGDYCVINPNCSTSANVTLEGQNLVGVGSSLLAQTGMGLGAILGAGSVLTKDIPAGETWTGVPARRLNGPGEDQAFGS